ncbi:MAG TPA: cytochrome P450, partial [Trebonia sp.]|nr:cytochrome P450 [Trebonia sp.]
MTTMTIEQAGLMLTDPLSYTDEDRLHEALTLLRRTAPVHLVRAPGFQPFYAVTRHADIMDVERDGALWLSEPRPALASADSDQANRSGTVRTLVNMDDPDHRVVRAIGADWFRPRAMRALESRTRELARAHVDRLAGLGGQCDFAADIAAHYPLYVILSLLGLPESDFPRMLQLTRELFGAQDAELGRAEGKDSRMGVLLDFFTYFQELTAARRAHPTGDLASAIANAVVDGKPLDDVETMSYYVIIATAGHDTTSSTIAGGLQALLANPGELARLRAEPDLLPTAVDEMIRWVTPVKEFMRTASADTVLGGVPIAKGESVLLSYPSANRDDQVFSDPFRFDVGRDPNHHLAFGFGAHYCLGAALARMETRALFA